MENIYTVLVTAVTVLGSAAAFRFYERRAEKKRDDEFQYRYDCRDRISKLEALLEESSKEKEEMRKTILDLSTKVAELTTKIEFLEKKRG
jgi:septal ring factor EnvC (AmiA/AmiB activator)